MKIIAGSFIGTGAAIKIGLGFEPDFVMVRNIGEADIPYIEWSKHLENAVTSCDGILFREDTKMARASLTVGTGVRRYAGGDPISAASAAAIVPAHQVPALAGDMRRHCTAPIIDWTLDTAANRTGHVNAELNTTYIGVGSKLRIAVDSDRIHGDYVERTIVALTSNGEVADEVTLDREAPSGKVVGITYKYSFAQAPAGTVMPKGIVLAEATHVNASGQICFIEAGRYEID
jgi:hypothetical protein